MVWLKFVFCLAIILLAGTKLTKYGDIIAEKTGLSRVWIGLVLLAAVTSAPELVTGVSAAALVKLPDLAIGTLLGSCIFNLFIITILDVLYRRAPILSEVKPVHMVSAGLGILLIAVAGGAIFAGGSFGSLSWGWVGISGIITLVLYLLGARLLFRFEKKQPSTTAAKGSLYQEVTIRYAIIRFTLAALAVIGAGIWLSYTGDELAAATGWNTSFIGSLFLAVTTSMPELVVCVTAVRLGAPDMAIADILGANLLDIVAILWVDVSYIQGPILSEVSGTHFVTSMVIAAMSLLVILGIRFKTRRKTFGTFSWYVLLLIGLYIFGAYATFGAGLIP